MVNSQNLNTLSILVLNGVELIFQCSSRELKVDKILAKNWGTIPFIQGAPPTTDWRNRWTEENPSTTMPRIYLGLGMVGRKNYP